MDRSTLKNKLLHVPLITTTLREKWLAAEARKSRIDHVVRR